MRKNAPQYHHVILFLMGSSQKLIRSSVYLENNQT